MQKELRFPEGFLWGAATASYQVEGGIENCDWAEAARQGLVPGCGQACDHYRRFQSDFDMAKELGHNCHRISIEWARIEPEEGRFDEKEIEHYREVLQSLHERNLIPFITIWHFTLPQWFADKGGFEHKDAPKIFARYCAYVAEKLGDLCTNFSTINEPSVYCSNGWLRGSWPPFKRFSLTDMVSITNSGRSFEAKAKKEFRNLFLYFRVIKNLAVSHNAAYKLIKKIRPDSNVNFVHHVIVFDSNWNPINKIKAFISNQLWTHRFMRRTQGHFDSIGLNYYFYTQYGDKRKWRKTDMDWNFAPENIYDALMMLKRYGKPVFISEAGVADASDTSRAEYISRQIQGTFRAIQNGVDVKSHIYWSLLDNYEWALGFTKRFGLIEVNYETLERKIRPSAYVYKRIIENNGIVE